MIEGKPACRWRGLQLLLKLAFSDGEDLALLLRLLHKSVGISKPGRCCQASVRFDTIRLFILKIYSAGPRAAMRDPVHDCFCQAPPRSMNEHGILCGEHS